MTVTVFSDQRDPLESLRKVHDGTQPPRPGFYGVGLASAANEFVP